MRFLAMREKKILARALKSQRTVWEGGGGGESKHTFLRDI